MKKLFLALLVSGCIPVATGTESAGKPRYFTATPEADGIRVTVPTRDVSLVLPADGRPRGALVDGNNILFGVEDNGDVRYPEAQVNVAPDATTLAEQEATLRMWCLRLEIVSKKQTADGYELMVTCTKKNLESSFNYYRLSSVDQRSVQCSASGDLSAAKAGQRICGTLAAVPDAKIPHAQ